ncbi:hypothetical protein MBLNU457_5456t1 [Dothideomycetes sp. NU457]
MTVNANVASTSQPPDQQEGSAVDTAKHPLDAEELVCEAWATEVHSSPDESESSVVLSTELRLRHPERQLYRPAAQITCSMSIPYHNDDTHAQAAEDYMTSGVPLPQNLLQGLQNSPAFAGTKLQLPATRIQKVVPRSKVVSPEIRPVRGTSRQIAIVPALAVRLARSTIGHQTLISLEIEVLKWSNRGVVLEEVNESRMHEKHGPLHDIKLPQTMTVADKTTVIFRLDSVNHTELHVNARALLSDDCSPRLSIHRSIFPAPHNGQASHVKLTRHWQRPTSQVSRPTSMTVPDKGMTFSLSAPSRVNAGETFKLDILVVNRSVKKRRLAILAVTEAQKTGSTAKRSSKNASHPASDGTTDIARPIVDENTLYRAQNGQSRHATQAEIVSLTADAKVGPLAPGACHDVQLEFLALSPGVVGLEALTILDLDSRETVHITELPDVVALDEHESQ